ncbi:MAG TPA: AMP-binding protein [Thermoanaerobaculia bacterium]|nr:AMP-binding protein [Thermoanaerobaculia bacterium]
MKTLLDLIDALPRLGNRRAAGFAGEHGVRWWTYRELHEMAHRAARILASRGIERGQRILLHGPNSPEWVAFFLGAVLRGIVVVPVDANETTARLLKIARLTGAVFLIDVEANPRIGIPRHDLHNLSGGGEAILTVGTDNLACPPQDPAAILFTSGSTGAPRGVVLTHANLMHQAAPFLRFRAPLRLLRFRLLALSPLSHVQGLVVGLLIPYAIGLIVLYTHSAEPRHLIRTIRTSRIRFLNAVPRVLDLLERELRIEIGDGGFRAMARVMGRRFRVILAGGAALPAAREAFWRKSLVAVVQGYGLTETSALATINLPFLGRAGSIGFAMHRHSIRIADDGEILVRGPHVASQFIGDAADAFTENGELRTGDLATRDGRNRLFFIGRKKDAIVTAEGHTVHPAAIESRLVAHVRDAVVLSLQRDGLEELHAVLLLDRESSAADAVQRTNLELAPHERIRGWTAWPDDDFPRTLLGKPDRAEIARRIRVVPAPRPAAPPPNLLIASREPDPQRRVAALVQWFAAHRDANVSETLRDQGVDSIEVLQILTRLEHVEAAEPVEADVDVREWSVVEGLQPLRWLVRRALVDPVLAVTTPVRVEGAQHLAGLDARTFFAIDGDSRMDRADFLRVYRAVPRRLRGDLMFLLASHNLRGDGQPRWFRAYMKTVLHFAMPVFIPFTLFPKRTETGTAEALRRACACIDRGFAPLTTWGRGTAVMATECRLTVVPVQLLDEGKGRATVRFFAPIAPHPTRGSDELYELVRRAFGRDDESASGGPARPAALT